MRRSQVKLLSNRERASEDVLPDPCSSVYLVFVKRLVKIKVTYYAVILFCQSLLISKRIFHFCGYCLRAHAQ